MAQLRIFVSHATEDAAFAERIAADLRHAGADVWLDSTHLAGERGNFVARINRALQDRDVLLLVLSQSAITSQWVPDEMDAAIVRYKQGFMQAPLVLLAAPVSLRDIPALWTTYNRVDATRNYDEAMALVLKGLNLTPPAPIAPALPASPPPAPHAPAPIPATPATIRSTPVPPPAPQARTAPSGTIPAGSAATTMQRRNQAVRPLVGVLILALLTASVLKLYSSRGNGGTSQYRGTSGTSNYDSGATLHVVQAGKLTVGSDTTYAPAEFIDSAKSGSASFVGYDMDLGRELARRLKLAFTPRTASYDTIIGDISVPALGSQAYDISISSFLINSARQQQVDMIPYLRAGESLLVAKGNPDHITRIDDLCGRTVSVQNGTTELSELKDANGEGDTTSGQAPVCATNKIILLTFDSETDVINQVLSGRAQAAYQDQPITGYYVSLHRDSVAEGGTPVAPTALGIVVRKDNAALETAIKNALAAMMADGTYKHILDNWGAGELACNRADCSS